MCALTSNKTSRSNLIRSRSPCSSAERLLVSRSSLMGGSHSCGLISAGLLPAIAPQLESPSSPCQQAQQPSMLPSFWSPASGGCECGLMYPKYFGSFAAKLGKPNDKVVEAHPVKDKALNNSTPTGPSGANSGYCHYLACIESCLFFWVRRRCRIMPNVEIPVHRHGKHVAKEQHHSPQRLLILAHPFVVKHIVDVES